MNCNKALEVASECSVMVTITNNVVLTALVLGVEVAPKVKRPPLA